MLPFRYAIWTLLSCNYLKAIEVQEALLVSTPGGYDLRLKVSLSDVRTTGNTPTYGSTVTEAQLDDGTMVTLNKPVQVDMAGSAVPYVDISWIFGDPVDEIEQHEVLNCGTSCPMSTITEGYKDLHWQSISADRVDEILDKVKCTSIQNCRMEYTANPPFPWLDLGGAGSSYYMMPNDLTDLSWAHRENSNKYQDDWSEGFTKKGVVRKYVPGQPNNCPNYCDLSSLTSYKSDCGSSPYCPCFDDCLYKGCTENGLNWAGGMCNIQHTNRGAPQGGSHEIEDESASFIENKYKNWFVGLQDRQLTYNGMLVWGSTTPYSYMQYQKWRLVWDTYSTGIQNRLMCDSTTPKGQGLTGKTAWYWRSNWDATQGLSQCSGCGDNGVHWKNDAEYRKISYVFESEATHLNDLLATFKVDGIENAGISVSDNKHAVLAKLQTQRLVMDDPGLTGSYPASTTWRFFNATAFHYSCHGVMVDALAWAHQGFDRLVYDSTTPSATFAANNNGSVQPYCSRARDYCMENIFSTWDNSAHGYKSIPGAESYTDTKAQTDFGYAPDSVPTPLYEESTLIEDGVRKYSHGGVKTRITLGMPVWLTLSNIVRALGPKINLSSSFVVIPEDGHTFRVEATIINIALQNAFHLETTCIQHENSVSGDAHTVAADALQNLILNVPATCIMGSDWLSGDYPFRVTTGTNYGTVYDTNLPFTISLTAPITHTCICPNGVAAVSTACTEQGANICTSCTTIGFHLVDATCAENVCTCSNGEATTGESCTFHLASSCSSCDLSWHLTNTACIANVCTCPNGEAAPGESCTSHQASSCSSCVLGWHLTNTACIANGCTCANGEAASGESCTDHQASSCSSCDLGWHLTNGACIENVCTCDNGEATSGESCTFHEASSCSSCDLGWHLTNSACIANTCTCSNGVPATGLNCTNHQAAICSSCSTGYEYHNNTCLPKPCVCPNGTAAKADNCTTPGAQICTSCNDGWRINTTASSCLANSCTCTGGAPASGEQCITHGLGICADCPSGYADLRGVCTIQPCVCENGTPISPDRCTTTGANICASCNPGFTLHSTVCQANTCYCNGGTPVSGALCTSDGAMICGSCHDYYTLTSNTCIANECSCLDGTVTSECSVDGAVSCSSCNTHYHLHNENCTLAENHDNFEFLGSGTCTTPYGPPKAYMKASVSEEDCKSTSLLHAMLGFAHSWDDLCILYPGTVAFEDTTYTGPTDVANTGSISGIIAGHSVMCYRAIARIVEVLQSHTVIEPTTEPSITVTEPWQDACVFLSSVQVLRVEGNFIFHNKVCHERLQGTYIVDTSTCIKYLVAYDSDGQTAGDHKSSKTGLYECDQTTGERIGLPNEGSLSLMIDHEIMFTARWSEVMAFCGQISDQVLTDTLTIRLLLDYDSFADGTASGSDIQEELINQLAIAGNINPDHISIDSWTKGSIIGVVTVTGSINQPAADSKQLMQNLITERADNHVHEEKHGLNKTNGASILDWIDPWYVDGNQQSVVFSKCPINIHAVIPHGEARINVEWDSPKAFFHKSKTDTPQPATVTQIYGGQSGAPFQAGGHFIRYMASSSNSSVHAIPCTFVVTVTREEIVETSAPALPEAVITDKDNEAQKTPFMAGQMARLIAGIIFVTICGFGCCYWYGRNPRGASGIVREISSIIERSATLKKRKSRYHSLRSTREKNSGAWESEVSSDDSIKSHEKISLISMAKGIHELAAYSEEDLVADIEMSSPRSIKPKPPSHPNTTRSRLTAARREVLDDEPDLRSVEICERESLFD